MSNQGPVIISGVTGQDGSYLADLLVGMGLRVVGLTRDPGLLFSDNIGHLQGRMTLCYTPYSFQSILEIVERIRPAKIFNLAGQSYVIKSWEMLDETITASGTIPCYFLEAIVRTNPEIKYFQASSAEIFSPDDGQGLHEGSPILPRTPYGCAKAMAHHMVASYRENYGIFAVNGILFNHESPRRRANFLSRKIVNEAVRIKRGLSQELRLGNLEVRRDWGYAPRRDRRRVANCAWRNRLRAAVCDSGTARRRFHSGDLAGASARRPGFCAGAGELGIVAEESRRGIV